MICAKISICCEIPENDHTLLLVVPLPIYLPYLLNRSSHIPYMQKFLLRTNFRGQATSTKVKTMKICTHKELATVMAVIKTWNGMEWNRTERSVIFRLLTESFDLGLGILKSKFLGFRERYCMASGGRIQKRTEWDSLFHSVPFHSVPVGYFDPRKFIPSKF